MLAFSSIITFLLAGLIAQEPPGYTRASELFQATDGALAAMRSDLTAHPDDPWAWHFLARALQESRLQAEALVALERAASLAPGEAFHHQALASHEEHLRSDFGAAARHYRRAAALETRERERAWLEERARACESKVARADEARGRLWWLFGFALAGLGVAFFLWGR